MDTELSDKFLFKLLLNIMSNMLPEKEKADYKETIFRKNTISMGLPSKMPFQNLRHPTRRYGS